MRSSAAGSPRVFIGLREYSGYLTRLCEGLQELGVRVTYFDIQPNPFRYKDHRYRHGLLRLAQRVGLLMPAGWRGELLVGVLWVVWLQLAQLAVFIWALPRFDTFVFYARRTFLFGMLDLPILKWFRKRVIHISGGYDVRPRYLVRDLGPLESLRQVRTAIRCARRQKEAVRWLERYCDELVGFPLYSHYFERPIIDNTWIGTPVPVTVGLSAACPGDILRIVHAPSDPVLKGTRIIREVIRRIAERGYPIEYIEISGQPNRVVLREFSRCSFVVDQVYSDAPVTTVVTEAALFGKPTIVGSYACEEFARIFGSGRLPPSYVCHPDDLERAILELVTNPKLREEMGRRAYEFVRTHWKPVEVARRMWRVIVGDVPSEWYFDPRHLRYVHGFGLPEHEVRNRIRALVTCGGREALQLGDKPELENKFLALAAIT